jgi:hypothetical protein
VMFSPVRSPALKAVIAIGVAWTVDSRFSAVTTISSSPAFSPEAGGAASADALMAMAQGSAKTIHAWITPRTYLANNTLFISESP